MVRNRCYAAMARPGTPAWGTFLVLHREDASELPVAHCCPRIIDVRQQVSSNIETAGRPEAVDLAIGQLANASKDESCQLSVPSCKAR
jgi:hypothetical protein